MSLEGSMKLFFKELWNDPGRILEGSRKDLERAVKKNEEKPQKNPGKWIERS